MPAVTHARNRANDLRIIESPLATPDHALTPTAAAVKLDVDPPRVASGLRHLTSPFGTRLPYGQGAFGWALKPLKPSFPGRPSHPFQEGRRRKGFDAERSEADRITRRGFDFDPTAPSHEDYLRAQPIPEIKSDPHWTPAYSLVAVCRRYGVALRIYHDGTLVVGKAGAKAEEPTQPWSTLIRAIEAHLDAVAELVASGWSLRAEFPQTEVA